MKDKALRYWLLLLAFSFPAHLLIAQATITGKITDANTGEPLIGASILLKDGLAGTVSDYDGNFELKTGKDYPVTISFSYTGYEEKEFTIRSEQQSDLEVELEETAVLIESIEVTGQRISEKQKASPLTVESLDVLAIKETPSDNFYDGLGNLKGVDLTAASLGFKVINTRGFNSTSPVRSLQIIDGVDNQAPGLNFSLGNFLGAPEQDVLKVDLIQGASSAYYGPNAFNGVISMQTKNPFYSKGLSVSMKLGERNLIETSLRFADATRNKAGNEFLAYKLNFSYLQANDWEADNYDPVYNTITGRDNPGRYNAVNIYGDEYNTLMDLSNANPWNFRGLGIWHRTGYREIDIVDYDTENYKANLSLHLRTNPSAGSDSPEFILSSNFGSGTTVYQGDNRFSLRNILFFQNRLEFSKKDKYFIRVYATHEDAGDSYDPYFTALKLQEAAKDDQSWAQDYRKYWTENIEPRMEALGVPDLEIDFVDGMIVYNWDNKAYEQWLETYQDSLFAWHSETEFQANFGEHDNGNTDFYQPGTERFEELFDEITSAKGNEEEDGTRFYDKSALYHAAAEYNFEPQFAERWVVGASARLYTPESDGTIFTDTAGTDITNFEYGVYTGLEKEFFNKKLRASATIRVDKNENFDLISTPAASLVYKPKANNYLRVSFSSAIRNPTLTDQYLNLNVGPAILSGNLNGVDSVVTLESFDCYRKSLDIDCLEYISIDPVRPEKVRTFEVGYRTTLWNKLYVDAGYYYSIYTDFLGFNIVVDAEFDVIGLPSNLQVYRYSANSVNEVNTQGFSIGLNYYFAKYYQLSGNYSWNQLTKTVEDDPIIPAFNTPEHKFNIGISGRNINEKILGIPLKNFGFNVNYKWIDGFLFEGSPQFTGFIPSYDLLDAQVNYTVNEWNTTFKLGASNILNNKQFQTYGGPRIGRLAYFSILYDFKKSIN